MSKISWHLTIADIPNTRIKQHLGTICHNKIRYWLEIPPNGTLDIILLSKIWFKRNRCIYKTYPIPSFTTEKVGNIRK